MTVAPVLSTYPALPSSPTGNSRMSCRGCCKEQWELNAAATTAARMARGILIWSPCTVVRLDRRLSAWDIRFMARKVARGCDSGCPEHADLAGGSYLPDGRRRLPFGRAA